MSHEARYWQDAAELAAGKARTPHPDEGSLRRSLEEGAGETRRDLLKAMGFSLGAAWAAGCRIPERRALPFSHQPEGVTPGVASWYATTCGGCGAGCGLLVKVRDGRPIKIEGNPDSPLSGGGTCALGQGTVLSLYDDHRLRGPRWRGEPASWEALDATVRAGLDAAAAAGKVILLITEERGGPSWRRLLSEWQARFPTARVVIDQPLALGVLRRAQGQSFGRAAVPRLRFAGLDLVLGLEADFLGTWLSPVEHARAYAARRRPATGMLRHVQIESAFSLTGSNADLRLPVHPSEVGAAAVGLLAEVARLAGSPLAAALEPGAQLPGIAALAAELWAHRGRSAVLAGEGELELHLVVNRINHLLGNVGTTLDLDNPSYQSEGDAADFLAALAAMERGEVGALLVAGGNPAYHHPHAARFIAAAKRVPLTVSFADRPDETSRHLDAWCPDVHFLEAWNDAEPVAGCFQLTQPAIAPLFDARPVAESLLAWAGRPARWYDYLRATWERELFPRQTQHPTFDAFWDHALERGLFEAAPSPRGAHPDRSTEATLATAAATLLARRREGEASRARGEAELRLVASVGLRGGRWANNPWLQELPDPVSKETWGNSLAVSPALALRLGLTDGDVVACTPPAAPRLELPIVVQPGLAEGTVAVAVGYGRENAGKVASGVGVNTFRWLLAEDGALRCSRPGVTIEPTGRRREPARTQRQLSAEGRPIVRETTLAALAETGEHGAAEELPSLWPEHDKPEHFWAMSIDLNACTGCSACVIACQAENNVAVVGEEEVRRGREMHWLRIDRYYRGPVEAPAVVHQPMLCQHCDHAPCETVCPVLATVHSSDGLNQQVYNRCIGTRYCANNCPYKVRRFNWFRYAENERFGFTQESALARLVLNPDVVVRSRGVMEKCSLCVQRIQEGKLAAKRAGEELRDGAIQTACQQACPTRAIVFGDRKDAASAVSANERDRRSFRVLEELGTRPGVSYLARVRATEGSDVD